MVRQLSPVFFHAVILSRVWEWSDSGTNTRLRTRLARRSDELLLLLSSFSTIRAGHRCRASCWIEVLYSWSDAWFFV